MTVAITTSDVDFELAELTESEIADSGNSDPMDSIERLPEVSIPIGSLVPGLYLRQEGTDVAHVRVLADAADTARLPSILVQKNGSRIIDGMHRVEVAKLRGEWKIRARVVDCTDAEALVLAVKSNSLHGLPLSRADRISGAKRILNDHADWSDRALAAITGLSAKAIASIRNTSTGGTQFCGKRLGRDGKRRPIVPAEGRQRAAEYIIAHPDASLRQIARETDVSLGTVHAVKDRIRRGEDCTPRAREWPMAEGRFAAEGLPAEQAPLRPVTAAAAPPLPVRAIHPAAAERNVQQLAWPAIAVKLAGDPSLRYTEGGRAFLRWMSGHCVQADEWREFIDAIPPHWLDEVRRIAASMSDEWQLFAERLASKIQAAS